MQSGEGEVEEEEEDGLTWSKRGSEVSSVGLKCLQCACVKGRRPGSGEAPDLRIACACS